MTIRLSLQESVDFCKIAKKAIAASDTSDKETAFEILRGSEELHLDQDLKRLAEDSIEDLHLYFPKTVSFDGVEPPNRGMLSPVMLPISAVFCCTFSQIALTTTILSQRLSKPWLDPT